MIGRSSDRVVRALYHTFREAGLVGESLDRMARATYWSARGLGRAWRWYRESHERGRFVHILEAVNYLRIAGLPRVYFEFGCYSGQTFSAALLAARFLRIDLDAYAFDSFEGLPESGDEESRVFPKGSFAAGIRSFKNAVRSRSGVALADSHVIPGFYDVSLTDSLARRLPPEVGFVHIDVDLYVSTVPVLEFILDKLVEGSVLLFDDWYCFPPGQPRGERRALEEFCDRHSEIVLEHWKNYSLFGRSFLVVRTGRAVGRT